MVPLIIVYLHRESQLLVRGAGVGGRVCEPSTGRRAPFVGAGPPPRPAVCESARRSAPSTGPRVGDSPQLQLANASRLPQRFCGTCLRWRGGLVACPPTPARPAYPRRRLCQGRVVSLTLLLSGRGRPARATQHPGGPGTRPPRLLPLRECPEPRRLAPADAWQTAPGRPQATGGVPHGTPTADAGLPRGHTPVGTALCGMAPTQAGTPRCPPRIHARANPHTRRTA
jgi:hypothetical protein